MKNYDVPERKPGTFHRLRIISRINSFIIIGIGVLVLFGWLFKVEHLIRLQPNMVAMSPVTAICLILCGIGMMLSREKFGRRYQKWINFIAVFLLVINGLKIVELLTPLRIPVDQVLFRKQLWNPVLQKYNVMAPNTSFSFILAALAFLFINYETAKGQRPAQYFSILITLLALLSLYGYVYNITSLYTISTYLPMALHTALAFLLLGIGFLFSRPDKGTMAIIIGENSGEIIFMRFLALILPLLFGWVRLQGEHAGIYSTEYGTALFAVLTYAMAMFLLGRQSYLQYQIRKTKQIAMDAIRENERRLQAILDNTGTLISIKTPLGKYTLVNRQFEKAFNISSGQALGKTDADLFPKELVEELIEYDNKVLQSQEPRSFEEKYPHADGVHTYVTVKFPLFNEEHKVYALGAVSTDITKRKRLELELRKSHQRLFGILDNIGEGVVVADHDGNFIIYNKRAEEILGIGALNITWEEWSRSYGIFHADGTTYFRFEELPLFKAIKGEQADNVEMIIRNEKVPDGKWIAVTGRPVCIDQNEVIAGVAVFRDITLRKQLEKMFSENERRLRLILANIGEGVMMLNKKAEVLLFNRKIEEIFGAVEKNLPLEKWPEYYGIYIPGTMAHYPAEALPFAKALRGETCEDAEMLILNKKLPEGKSVLVTGRPIHDTNGAITGGIIDMKDVTEQRKLEEYLKEIQDQFHNLLNQQRPFV